MALYASLDDARMENNAKSTNTSDNNNLLRYLRQISRRIDNMFHMAGWPVRPVFEPYIETRIWPLSNANLNNVLRTYTLPASLLALTGVQVASETLAVGTLVEGWPDSSSPITALRLIDCCNSWWSFDCGTCSEPTLINVTGTWGIHSDYANAWQHVDDLAGAINDTVTSLTVADVDGVDLYGITPRISVGNLLRIGTEYLEVTATNTGTNAVTVRRGVNGSTAASHAMGDDVDVWTVEEPIRREVARQAAFLNARRGAYSTVDISALGETRYPSDLLGSLRGVLQEYAYR